MIALLGWILQPKNAILTAIVLAFLGLFAHDRYLSHVISNRDNEIIVLNTNINNLKSSIELQNQAIKNMNEDFLKQKNDFNIKYEEVKKSNESKLKRIKNQENYVSPNEVKTTEEQVNQGKLILKDYLKNRRGLQ